MSSGKVVIGFDGTPIAEHAVRQAAELLAPRAVVVLGSTSRGVIAKAFCPVVVVRGT